MQNPKRVSATPSDDDDDSGLKINGNKIKLEKFPHEIKINYNVKKSHYNFDRPSDKHREDRQETTKVSRDKRQLYHLKIKDCTNVEVRNRRLKEIHEAVELDDFKRFLVKNYNINKRGAKNDVAAAAAVVNLDLIKGIYWESFGKHYKFLKNLINKADSKCCE